MVGKRKFDGALKTKSTLTFIKFKTANGLS
jgi:hypothetical protein